MFPLKKAWLDSSSFGESIRIGLPAIECRKTYSPAGIHWFRFSAIEIQSVDGRARAIAAKEGVFDLTLSLDRDTAGEVESHWALPVINFGSGTEPCRHYLNGLLRTFEKAGTESCEADGGDCC